MLKIVRKQTLEINFLNLKKTIKKKPYKSRISYLMEIINHITFNIGSETVILIFYATTQPVSIGKMIKSSCFPQSFTRFNSTSWKTPRSQETWVVWLGSCSIKSKVETFLGTSNLDSW